VCVGLFVFAAPLAAQTVESPDLETTLAFAAERVAAYFARAQSLVCLETVHIQPLGTGLGPDGVGRTVESELRLSWDPSEDGGTEAATRRQVIKVNGRPPRKNDYRACTTPEQEATETQPLSMLLVEQRDEYTFALAGVDRVDKRPAIRVDYRLKAKPTVEVKMVEGLDDCVSYDVSGGRQGRLWIDAETFDVLRLDQRLSGYVEFRVPSEIARRPGATAYWTLERHDITTRFKRVSFEEPAETLVLPVSQTSINITRGAGTPRQRTITEYKAYKRFITGGRIITEPKDKE